MARETHIMLDIETLGTKPGCVVLSVDAAKFSPETGEVTDTFYEAISFKDSVLCGLIVDPKTYAWWQQQDSVAFKQAFAGETPLGEAAQKFRKFGTADHWWAQGADFDFPIWGEAIGRTNSTAPWKFYQVRDTRTLYAVAGLNKDSIVRAGTFHNALDDRLHQIKCVHGCYRMLGIDCKPAARQSAHEEIDETEGMGDLLG